MKKVFLALILAFIAAVPSINAGVLPINNTEDSDEFPDADMIKMCKWYVSELPSDDPEMADLRKTAAQMIITYCIDTSKFKMTFGDTVANLLELGKHKDMEDLLIVYMAGETAYCLEHNLKKNDAASFASAMQDVMNYYAQLPDHPIKTLNKYLDMSEAQRQVEFAKLYKPEK